MRIQLLFPIVVYFPSFPLLILLFGSHLIILIYHSSIHSLSFVGDIAAFIILFDVCVMYIGWFGRHLFLYWLFVEFWLWCWCHSLYVYVLLLCYCCTCNTWAYNYHILINITHSLLSRRNECSLSQHAFGDRVRARMFASLLTVGATCIHVQFGVSKLFSVI